MALSVSERIEADMPSWVLVCWPTLERAGQRWHHELAARGGGTTACGKLATPRSVARHRVATLDGKTICRLCAKAVENGAEVRR